MDGQPLKPLTHGNILIVGAKASNFSEDIKSHPRVIIWDSQNEHWLGKSLPVNVQAVFVTRWIGHNSFGTILAEARKRHITMFNPEGTGIIAKQVKELLDMNKQPTIVDADRSINKPKVYGKLNVLIPHIDWDKSNVGNAEILMVKAREIGITSTPSSLANFVGVQRRRRDGQPDAGLKHRRQTHPVVKVKTDGLDVSVQMLDDAIQSMKDMRDFLMATVEENRRLKIRLDKFKKMVEEG